ncbi:UNVERIFIED_CONTAM: hypothetical protein K2H54_020531 [Gekko kuhli]
MGTKQTKGCAAPGSGSSPTTATTTAPPGNCARRKAPSRERGDFLASLVARSSEKFGKGGGLPPYHRRIGMIQDMLRLVKQGRQEEATDLLKHLRQPFPKQGGWAAILASVLPFVGACLSALNVTEAVRMLLGSARLCDALCCWCFGGQAPPASPAPVPAAQYPPRRYGSGVHRLRARKSFIVMLVVAWSAYSGRCFLGASGVSIILFILTFFQAARGELSRGLPAEPVLGVSPANARV